MNRSSIPSCFERAELRLTHLIPPVRSFEARFFADEPAANVDTQTYENRHFLATQFFYGLGVPDNGEVRFPYTAERDSQSIPTTVRVNITAGLKNVLQYVTSDSFPVTVVFVERNGAECVDADFDLEKATLVVK